MTAPLPVTLLTGFLGSGKTTVLNHLLRQAPLTAVVMNEFGEVGLDHQLLEESRGPLALLSGGCVCCQVQGSLAPTLKNLWMARDKGDLPPFERLVIETTGIADPAPIADTLVNDRWLAARFLLDGIVTTVDAGFAAGQLDQHSEAMRQVASADRLLLTKSDLADPTETAALRTRLAYLNPGADCIDVVRGEAAPEQVFDLGGHGRVRTRRWLALPAATALKSRLGAAPDRHGIRSFSLRFETPLDRAGVAAALEMLVAFRPKQLLRMKALVNFVGETRPTVLHGIQHVLYPPVQLAAWPDDDHASRFVFIVSDLDEAFVGKLMTDFIEASQQGHLSVSGMA